MSTNNRTASLSKLSLKKVNILLVDDKPNNLLALEAVLSGPEYHLYSADSGAQAIEIAQKHDIGLILLDVQMPQMDGFETAKKIKALDKCRDIPIIFITAIYKEDPFVKKGFEVGAIDYFSKPFDPDILKMKVGVYAALHQKNFLLRERENRIKETEELVKAGQKLSAILETLPAGVLIADSQGRICQINAEISRIWGFGESLKRDLYGEFLEWWNRDGQLLKGADGPVANALKTGETSHNEITEIVCFDGRSKSVLNSASPLRDFEGNIVGVVLVVQDVTEHKRIEMDFEERIQKLVSLGFEFEQTAH